MGKLRRLLQLAPSFYRLYTDLKSQETFIDLSLNKTGALYFIANDFANLPRKEIKRLKQYGTFVYTGVAQVFAALRGEPITIKERALILALSFYAALRDDIDDKEHHHIENRIQHKIKNLLLTYMQENAPNKDLFNQYHTLCIEAQVKSRAQYDPHIDNEQIRSISFDKCGYAFLLTRALLDHPLDDKEEKIIYQYGCAAQLGDDLLDWYDDMHEGAHTLANRMPLPDFKNLFALEVNKSKALLARYTADQRNIVKAMNRMRIMFSIFEVGIDLMEELNIDTTETPPGPHEREQYVVNMQNQKFMLRSIKKFLRSA